MSRLLLIPHIKMQNANALSSPFTIGFPATTAWLGFVHALQRKLNQQGFNSLNFYATGIISHQCDLQIFRGPGDFVNSIIGTANPLNKEGKRTAFIEEGRCHLEVSLVIAYDSEDEKELRRFEQDSFIKTLSSLLLTMKIAGGDILEVEEPEIFVLSLDDSNESHQILCRLMPGYALLERRDLMKSAMDEGKDAIDALLDFLVVNHQCEKRADESIEWKTQRKTSGWIVPIATGFHGISDLAKAKNQRDLETPHRFAESVVTLGEFVMAHRLNSILDMLWVYTYDPENNLYLCQQHNEYSI